MKVARRVDLESFYRKKKNVYLCMVKDVNWIYHGDHFAIRTNIKSLHYTHETNITLHNDTSKKSPVAEHYWFTQQYQSQVYDHMVQGIL